MPAISLFSLLIIGTEKPMEFGVLSLCSLGFVGYIPKYQLPCPLYFDSGVKGQDNFYS